MTVGACPRTRTASARLCVTWSGHTSPTRRRTIIETALNPLRYLPYSANRLVPARVALRHIVPAADRRNHESSRVSACVCTLVVSGSPIKRSLCDKSRYAHFPNLLSESGAHRSIFGDIFVAKGVHTRTAAPNASSSSIAIGLCATSLSPLVMIGYPLHRWKAFRQYHLLPAIQQRTPQNNISESPRPNGTGKRFWLSPFASSFTGRNTPTSL